MTKMVGDAIATLFPELVPAPLRILVVDRSTDITEQFAVLLAHFGHRAYTARDAAGAMRMVDEMPFDVVISGLKLPGVDGFELARLLRVHPHAMAARLIAVSGASGEEVVAEAKRAGFDEHHCKPVSVDVIVESLGM